MQIKLRVLSIMPKIPEISVGIQIESPFRFLPTGIFGITSGGGPLYLVGIFRPKFTVPFLTNRFFARNSEKEEKVARAIPISCSTLFPLISDRSVWHNESTPIFTREVLYEASF